LDQRGHDPRRIFVEVYDHPQPTARVDVSAVEMLTAREQVGSAVVWVGYRPEDQVNLLHQLGPTECQMQARASVEDYAAAFGVPGAWMVVCHTRKLRPA